MPHAIAADTAMMTAMTRRRPKRLASSPPARLAPTASSAPSAAAPSLIPEALVLVEQRVFG
jgi:hypothetical protein